ncbi:MAG: carbohydrate ABC transporter permease, partial [Candidatus Gallimonas sp.]
MATQKKRKFSRRDNIWGLALMSPPLIGFLLFTLIPLCFSLYMSVCSTKGFLVSNMHFLGFSDLFGNFKEVLTDPLFYKALLNTLYSLVSLPISMILSLLISVLLTNKKIPHRKIFRTIFFLPYVCSIVALTTMWRTAVLD